MSKFILVYYGTDFGMNMLGEYATKQDAFNDMIREIEITYKPSLDMSVRKPYDGEYFEYGEDGRSILYWGNDWANCYGRDGDYSDHYRIFEV